MSDIAIRVENLSKLYHIGAQQRHDTLRDAIVSRLRRPNLQPSGPQPSTDLWALKGVSFEVRRGKVVGVIGRNGSGKSTLLKLLSRVTEPTSGRAQIHGRVASLLEVGTGFHPELTGRENIFLNGAILGMTRNDIVRQFDEIVAFSEIEKFLDTPVKRYSSGMYVRLAFAVAAHLDPEILLVDEVLAVGDVEFQRKCLGKMKEVSGGGRTVLFVSHNMGAVGSICEKAIVLERGEVVYQGRSGDAVQHYLNMQLHKPRSVVGEQVSTNGALVLKNVTVSNRAGQQCDAFGMHEDVLVHVQFETRRLVQDLAVGLTLATQAGEVVFSSYHADTPPLDQLLDFPPGRYELQCTIPKLLLNELTYDLGLTFQIPAREILLDYKCVASIVIARTRAKVGQGVRPGVVKPELDWKLLAEGELS